MEGLSLYLESVDPERNRLRWYELIAFPLPGDRFHLIRRWGRIGRSSSSGRDDKLPSWDVCKRTVRRVLCLRARHGYEPTMPEAVQLSLWQASPNRLLHLLPDESSPWHSCLPNVWLGERAL